jgi:hypothetical protein
MVSLHGFLVRSRSKPGRITLDVHGELVRRQKWLAERQEVYKNQLDTDAPFRETTEAIDAAKARGILAVEMEAAALYTFAQVSRAPILCLAHVTNAMARIGQDFEREKRLEPRTRLLIAPLRRRLSEAPCLAHRTIARGGASIMSALTPMLAGQALAPWLLFPVRSHVDLTKATAAIKSPTGSITTYRRHTFVRSHASLRARCRVMTGPA